MTHNDDNDEVVVSYGDLTKRLEYTDAELECAEIAGVDLNGSPDSQEVIEILEGDDFGAETAAVQETERGYNVDVYGSLRPTRGETSDQDLSDQDVIARLEYRETGVEEDDDPVEDEYQVFEGGTDRR